MRRRDWADDKAEAIYDMVRNCAPDEDVVEEIARALRRAKGVTEPPQLSDEATELLKVGQDRGVE